MNVVYLEVVKLIVKASYFYLDSKEGRARTRGAALMEGKADRRGTAAASHQAAQPLRSGPIKVCEIDLR
jgi:hypothetical protein